MTEPMNVEESPPAAPNEAADSAGQEDAHPAVPKLPPCDQCRRRKVRCDGQRICSRCSSSQLTCTRDIARKKRGPKKGSGSVIAKLRDETHGTSPQDANLPPFDFSQLRIQMPSQNAQFKNESPVDSPLTSPTGSQFGDGYLSDMAGMPRSIPLEYQNGLDFTSHTAFAQAGIQLPASWQFQSSELLQFQPPISPTGYMTVTDLAQQIFPEAPTSVPDSGFRPTSNMTMHSLATSQQTPSRTSTPLTKPQSLDAMLSSSATSPAATTTTNSSPGPVNGPKYLYRSDSGPNQFEPRIASLASEFAMSAFLISQCIRQYFRHLYPTCPMIHEATFLQRLQSNEDLSNEEKILILSICATTVVHAAPQSDLSLDKRWQLGKQFLDLCFYLRRNYDWAESASLASIQASYHICVALFEMKKPRSHHFYLREAVGMAHEQGLHLESTYIGMNSIQATCSRRTFAVLFITERGLAILRNKPTQISRLPRLSSDHFNDNDNIVLAGFSALVNLFSVLDEKFVKLWSATSPGEVTPAAEPLDNIAGIQHSLNEMSFDHFAMTGIQKADVLITHQWLRLIFWQASMRQGLISYSAADPIFSSSYPVAIARDLCEVMKDMTYGDILVHGLGIFEKLFEVAYTLMDALTIANRTWSESSDLRYLFDVLSASPNSNSTYVKMLETKIENERSPVNSPSGTSA